MKYPLFLSLVLCSCAFSQKEVDILIVPPPLSSLEASLWGPVSWELEWVSIRGIEHCQVPSGGLVVQLAADEVCGFSLRPCSDRSTGMPTPLSLPAGGLYPHDVRKGRLETDWVGGLAVNFFLELLRRERAGGRRAAAFNWPLFREVLEKGIEEGLLPEDPWCMDLGTVAAKTLDTGFDRRRLVASGPSRSVVLPQALSGWLSDSPFMRSQGQQGGESVELGTSSVRFFVSDSALFHTGVGGSLLIPRIQSE